MAQRRKNPPSQPRGSADVRRALDAFRRIVQALRTPGTTRGSLHLSHAQLFALQRIAEHPRASINDIAALTFTHQSSVSVVVQRLVERRLVAKVAASDDRRRQRLALTTRGRDVLERARSAVPERLIAAISALPPRDRRALAKALDVVAKGVSPIRQRTHPPMFMEDRASTRGWRSAAESRIRRA